jgi:Uma2 family endonuclease
VSVQLPRALEPAGWGDELPKNLIWRPTVAQYHQMIRSGVLSDDDPVELLNGWLVIKMAKNPPHRAAALLVRHELERVAPTGWYVEAQEPITLETSEPEPDAVLVRGTTRDYLDRHPGPADVALVVEVADTRLERDRILKKQLYAAAGIPVYWLLNLVDRQLEVYTEPTGPTEFPDYGTRVTRESGEGVAVVIAGQEVGRIAIADLLP